MAKLLIVGGTWDEGKGKPSSIIEEMAHSIHLTELYSQVIFRNGGNYYDDLPQVPVIAADVVLWFPHIPKDFKIEQSWTDVHLKSEGIKVDIKKSFPKIILVTSKNNYDEKYSFQEIVAHALSTKSNLIVEIKKDGNRFNGQIIDPLGNVWSEQTESFFDIANTLAYRTDFLRKITRKGTVQSPEMMIPMEEAVESQAVADREFTCPVSLRVFLNTVKTSANIFHDLVEPAKEVTRFLGNASFRCMRGFPSMRTEDGRFYVSKRNIDKNFIGPDGFVQVGLNILTDVVWYRGEHKPSVDTVIQLELYHQLPLINYMIHSHVYAKGAPFSKRMIPCGGLEEIEEIMTVVKDHGLDKQNYFGINLIGHGNIVCAAAPWYLSHTQYIAREVPEVMYE